MPHRSLGVAETTPRAPAPVDVARSVRALEPYQAVSSLEHISERPNQTPHKLDWNESTVPPSPRVHQAIAEHLAEPHNLNWYPVLNSANLVARLAAHHGVAGERFLVTNGSDDALATMCQTYLDEGDRVLVASPTYQHFLVFARGRGAEIVEHYAADPFASDVEGLRRRMSRMRPRLLYLVNPNNPTGVIYTPDEVASLLAASPETLVIVDEAYSEFSGVSATCLLDTYSNLAITRTFSKAYGLAGLRVGYLMGHPSVVADLRRLANPKSVNALAQVGAMAALADQDYLRWYLAEVDAAKRLMAKWLSKRKLHFRMTPANYVMVRFDQAPWVVHLLQEAGVYVRDRSHMTQLAGYVRFSVGTVEQTEEVLLRLGIVLDQLSR